MRTVLRWIARWKIIGVPLAPTLVASGLFVSSSDYWQAALVLVVGAAATGWAIVADLRRDADIRYLHRPEVERSAEMAIAGWASAADHARRFAEAFDCEEVTTESGRFLARVKCKLCGWQDDLPYVDRFDALSHVDLHRRRRDWRDPLRSVRLVRES